MINEAAKRWGGGDADGRIVGFSRSAGGELVMGKVCLHSVLWIVGCGLTMTSRKVSDVREERQRPDLTRLLGDCVAR